MELGTFSVVPPLAPPLAGLPMKIDMGHLKERKKSIEPYFQDCSLMIFPPSLLLGLHLFSIENPPQGLLNWHSSTFKGRVPVFSKQGDFFHPLLRVEGSNQTLETPVCISMLVPWMFSLSFPALS